MRIFAQKEADYLHTTRVTFENISKNPAIVVELEKVSYDAARIQEGLALQTEAQNLFRLLVEKRQSRLALTQQLGQQFKLVYREYAGHVNRLRRELASLPHMLEELDLVGLRKKKVSGFIEQATHFYNKAINDAAVAAVILPFGFTPQFLVDAQARFQQYQTERSTYEKSMGELQKLLVERDNAIKNLKAWIFSLAAAARVAFVDNLQTLEEIGFFMRNQSKSKKTVTTTPADTDPPAQGGTGDPPAEEPAVAA